MSERECNFVKRFIHPFIDGELHDKPYQFVLAHLRDCPKCRRYMNFFLDIKDRIWQLKAATRAPAQLKHKIHNQLQLSQNEY